MDELKEVTLLREYKKESGVSFEKIARGIGVSTLSVMSWLNKGVTPGELARRAIKLFLMGK